MRWDKPHTFVVLVAVLLLICGCTASYFRQADPPPAAHTAAVEWPIREYWTGIVFNGHRIGFTHFIMSPAPKHQGLYDIRCEAFIRTRFLWVDKTVHLESFDRVRADLTLQRFEYTYDLDGNRMTLEGQVENDTLVYTLQTRGQSDSRTMMLERSVHPVSVTGIYPLLQGLRIGTRHRYDVFDGQTQRVGPFEQEVTAYEESDLYSGPAFRVNSRFLGQRVTTWMDADGNPLLEMSMGGVIIATLEDETNARNSLTRAVLNKEESLIEFSRIKSDRIISAPDQVTSLQVLFSGVPEAVTIPSDFRQSCRRSGDEFLCRIEVRDPQPGSNRHVEPTEDLALAAYLQPTIAISARHPRIVRLAEEIIPAAATQGQQILSIVEWQQIHIRQEPVDVFTALDVLDRGKAECQGHALLFAALARSVGIPTRVVNGIVYVSEFEGFLYHSWNESYIDKRWVAVDPTFGQVPADATHVKLVEGHRLADLTPLLEIIGRVRVQVVEFE